jgi:hypothetical protein
VHKTAYFCLQLYAVVATDVEALSKRKAKGTTPKVQFGNFPKPLFTLINH